MLDASVGGLGGCPFSPNATGNIATEDLVWQLERDGVRTGIDLDALVATSRWLEGELGRQLAGYVYRAASWLRRWPRGTGMGSTTCARCSRSPSRSVGWSASGPTGMSATWRGGCGSTSAASTSGAYASGRTTARSSPGRGSRTDAGRTEFDVRADRAELLDEMFADPALGTVYAFDGDPAAVAALARQGFAPGAGTPMHFNSRSLDGPPEAPELPEGFRLRSVEPEDLAERVAIHRDVWAPSRVTEESYANVMQTWPYRASLDCVVEAPNGEFAAYCLVWPDDANAVCELEPVGTRERYRRLGPRRAPCARSRSGASRSRAVARRSSTA